MPGHDIVVIGFSAGGVGPLQQLAAGLPPDLPASVFVAHHFPATRTSALPDILRLAGRLPAVQPADGDDITPGRIYVTPPGRLLLLGGQRIRITNGSRRHGPHSTIDPCFRCAARSYGSRVIGVLLSGTLDDGTAGLLAIRRGGGLVVVQDPGETEYPGMVLSALEQLDVDHIARAGDMGALIDRLVRLAAPPPPPSGRRGRVATEVKHKPPLTGSTSQ